MWVHLLFEGIPESEIRELLPRLEAYTRIYEKGEYVVMQGSGSRTLGLLAEGRAFMEREDFLGKTYLYSQVSRDDPWGVGFLYPALEGSEFSCRAVTRCTFLFISYDRLTAPLREGEAARLRLLQNFMKAAAAQNHMLLEKLNLLSRRSLRERIFLYFYRLMQVQQRDILVSPLNRTELAEFLCVNRSALTRELSRMQKEGVLQMQRNMYAVRFPWSGRSGQEAPPSGRGG